MYVGLSTYTLLLPPVIKWLVYYVLAECPYRILEISKIPKMHETTYMSEKIINDRIPANQEALINAGYNHKLKHQKQDQKKDNSHQRKKQII